VNEAFPWNAGAMMWPSMLWSLPELPPELEYHFVGRDLVLVDTLGGIVVDVLRDALPVDGVSSQDAGDVPALAFARLHIDCSLAMES